MKGCGNSDAGERLASRAAGGHLPASADGWYMLGVEDIYVVAGYGVGFGKLDWTISAYSAPR